MIDTVVSFALALFASQPSLAECNFDVALASGRYIAELEKAELRRYQNNSVCEVLDNEVSSCSEGQLAKLQKAFDIKEVRGNYCQPHLPQPRTPPAKDAFLKGAELYSWKEYAGYHWFALLPGTNRQKTTKELIANRITRAVLKQILQNLRPSTDVTWNNLARIDDRQKLDFSVPNEAARSEIIEAAKKAQVGLKVF